MAEVQPDPNRPLRVVGRYALYGKLATGGMATVHFGRLLGPVGFSRTVAIKRLHPEFAKDPEFVAMFLDEARLAARIQHPNVVATVDVVAMAEELFLVMDYVRGESFSRVLRSAKKKGLELPEGFIGSVVGGMLHGLHAAHEATDERGAPLHVVHRDVSPQNVLVGVDGVPRVLDFGVAKAAARASVTRDGQMKGKLSYMSPEQLQGQRVDRRSDIFASGVVLWEALTGHRLFVGDDASQILTRIINMPVPAPSQVNPAVRPEVDALVLRALEKDPNARYATSREFAIAVEQGMQLLSPREVGEWVESVAGDSLEQRERDLAEIESISAVGHLSAFNDSEPQLMRTLVNTWSGQRRVVQSPGHAPPVPLGPNFPNRAPIISEIVSDRPAAPDDATVLYPTLEAPGDDKTQIYLDTGDATSPGKHRNTVGEPNPFERPRRRWIPVGLGAALLLVLGVVGASWVGNSPVQAPSKELETPSKAEAEPAHSAPQMRPTASSVAAERAPAPLDVEELPEADPIPQKPVPRRSTRPVRTTPSEPGPKAKCAQPWTMGADGVRRIRPECL